jgi:hypothetical protein
MSNRSPGVVVGRRSSDKPFPGTQIGASGAPRASRLPRLRPPRRQDGHTASMLKTIPPRVIPKTIPLRVMPQRRPPRVISQFTPLRVVGVGENCGQGVRRAEDLHVARCMTGRSRDEAGLLTRRRRSTRCGGDRHRSNRGCQEGYVVVHPRSHDHVPFDMLGMIPRPAPSSCLARHTGSSGTSVDSPTATNASFTATTKILRTTCQYRGGIASFRMRVLKGRVLTAGTHLAPQLASARVRCETARKAHVSGRRRCHPR